jgi:hypothetical protein
MVNVKVIRMVTVRALSRIVLLTVASVLHASHQFLTRLLFEWSPDVRALLQCAADRRSRAPMRDGGRILAER